MAPSDAMVARLGGDEFGLIFKVAEASEIDEVCRKALDSCTANFSVHGCEIDLTSSAGFVRSGDHKSRDAVDHIRYADIALYAAKHKDRNRACRFDTEIDETALFENAAQAATKLQTLRDLGFRIALDDFGTGYSTMFNIKNFAIDCIKINKCFVDDLGNDKQSAAIVASGRKDGQITVRGETVSHGRGAVFTQQRQGQGRDRSGGDPRRNSSGPRHRSGGLTVWATPFDDG